MIMTQCWGKTRRLKKLKRNGYFCLLALDHGLTSGPLPGISSIGEINNVIMFARKNLLPSVVINAGIVEKLENFTYPNLVLQLMGMPSISKKRLGKVVVSSVDSAISIDATAVSVQINFKTDDFQRVLKDISLVVRDANRYSLPVLFMINHDDWESAKDFNFAVRVSIELGADLIKVSLPSQKEIVDELQYFTDKHPPILLAGGGLSGKIIDKVRIAKKLGFQGICIGRNFFQSNEPDKLLSELDSIFGEE